MSQGWGSNPYYNNNPGLNGGGYMMDSPGSGGADSPGMSGRKSDAEQSLRPVTIKQVLDASQAHTDAPWAIEGEQIGQASMVAQVISIENHQTNTKFWLDDGTGRIEARQWWNSGNVDEDRDMDGITENAYVRVQGNIKSFANKKGLNVANIRPCPDPHELYFHLLEAMTVTLVHRRGEPGKGGAKNASTSGGSGAGMAAYNPAGGSGNVNTDRFAAYPEIQRKILEFIASQPDTPDGVRVSAIARAIGGNASDISQALDTLMDDGQVYSTIDEMHFKLSE